MMATKSHHSDAKVEVKVCIIIHLTLIFMDIKLVTKDDQLQEDARSYLLLDHACELM